MESAFFPVLALCIRKVPSFSAVRLKAVLTTTTTVTDYYKPRKRFASSSSTAKDADEQSDSVYATNHQPVQNVWVDQDVRLKQNKFNKKKVTHAGSFRAGNYEVPPELNLAINNAVLEKKSNLLRTDALALSRYIRERETPVSRAEYRIRYKQFYERFLREEHQNDGQYDNNRDDNDNELNLSSFQLANAEKRAAKRAKAELFNWKPMEYHAYDCAKYAVGRVNEEYAALRRVFHEIQRRDRTFMPKSVFDFGSGIGSTIWAANNAWGLGANLPPIEEIVCIDKNADMIDMAEKLLHGGDSNFMAAPGTTLPCAAPLIPNVQFRQYLPGSFDRQYDLCVSAYSLMELSMRQDRAVVLSNLWRKTKRYLVLIETGSKSGLQLILEARKMLLTHGDSGTGMRRHTREKFFGRKADDDVDGDGENAGKIDEALRGHVFAPCPHDAECPEQMRRGDDAICNFSAGFTPINFMRPVQERMGRTTANFSYVVLRKGARSSTTSENVDDDDIDDDPAMKHSFHRLIRPVEMKSKCLYCTLCCADGRLRMPIINKYKHTPDVFGVAASAQCGDLLPLRFEDEIYNVPALSATEPSSSPSEQHDQLTDTLLVNAEDDAVEQPQAQRA